MPWNPQEKYVKQTLQKKIIASKILHDRCTERLVGVLTGRVRAFSAKSVALDGGRR